MKAEMPSNRTVKKQRMEMAKNPRNRTPFPLLILDADDLSVKRGVV